MRLNYGDVIVVEECVGRVINAFVNQSCYTIKWYHNPHKQHYYQDVSIEFKCEVLPKDVGENLVRLYEKEVCFG